MIARRSWLRRAAVSVPAPDGYHYGDDHEWGATEQSSLITMMEDAREKLGKPAAEEAPPAG
jgi:hypothetical protein